MQMTYLYLCKQTTGAFYTNAVLRHSLYFLYLPCILYLQSALSRTLPIICSILPRETDKGTHKSWH